MKNILKNSMRTIKTFVALSIISLNVNTYGDDTEVFYSVNVYKPNLMFILDYSGSMNDPLSNTATTKTVEQSITHQDADSYQMATIADDGGVTLQGNVLNDNRIELSSQVAARFRFNELGIPQGTVISSAYLQFEAGNINGDGSNGEDLDLHIFTQDTNDAPLVQNGDLNVFGPVLWNVEDDWVQGSAGDDQRSPDVKQVVQDVINKGGWSDDNGLAFYITGITAGQNQAGKRYVNTFDNATNSGFGSVAKLIIEYDEGDKTKLQVLQESMRAVLHDEATSDNVRLSLMRFGPGFNTNETTTLNEGDRTHGISGVAFPATDINAKAIDVIPTAQDAYNLGVNPSENDQTKTYISDVIDNWTATGGTPIVGALYEASLYFRGEKMRYGYDSPDGALGVGAHPTTYKGNIITNDISNNTRNYNNAPNYKTPITGSCQNNYIALLSDGQPTYYYDGAANTQNAPWSESRGPLAEIMQGNTGYSNLAAAMPECADSPSGFTGGKCGPELTSYIASHDNLPDPSTAFPEGQEDNQFIRTFTIGFDTGVGSNTEQYLKSLATYDDPDTAAGPDTDGYFEASSPEALADAFRRIIGAATEPQGTLASPGYSVNVKNGLEHEKDIYIPVFDRKNTSRWSGNLKKFKIVDVNGRRLIRGKNNENATNEIGDFTEEALDYWSTSTEADGAFVEKGGLSSKLIQPNNRKIYSNLSGDSNITFTSTSTNRLTVANIVNNSITNAHLGLNTNSTEDYRKTILNFMLGWKNGDATSADKEPRLYMGDMLHSEPVVLTYDSGTAADESDKVQYIFAGTNEGYLHAFDTNTGEEKFVFAPAELLSGLSEHLYLNAGTEVDHKYGIDGAVTADVERNASGVATKVIIYFGLRRGGNSFYALDVTNIDEPKLLWKKGKTNSAPFNNMGQSWSTPYIARVGMGENGTPTAAVLVSGGYDEDEDRDLTDGSEELDISKIGGQISTADFDQGNNLYIFEAGNGSNAGRLLWSMPTAMQNRINNSIPGGMRPLDTNYNGLIDRIYFADTGANVWRIDLSEKIGDSSSTLTHLANLGGTGINNRMFFNEPDVSTLKLNGKEVFGISIGSGYRAHPKDETINDKFFYLVDDSAYKPLTGTDSSGYPTIVVSDLAQINLSGGSVDQVNNETIRDTGKRGWMINLPESGEKILGSSIAVDGNIIFTSLIPEVYTQSVDPCAAPITQSRLYAFNVLTGEPGLDLDLNENINDSDAYITTGTEILGKPQIVFNTPEFPPILDDQGDDTGEVGCTHPVDIRTGKKLSQATGYEACRLESVYWSDPVKEE